MTPRAYTCYLAVACYLLALAGAQMMPYAYSAGHTVKPPPPPAAAILPIRSSSQPSALSWPLQSQSRHAPTQNHSPASRPSVMGFSLNVHHTDKLPLYFQAIDQIAQLGCNSLQILTPAFQTHGGSDTIARPVGPGRCPSSEDLRRLLKHAKRRGLLTLLMPTILFTQPRGNEWRGKISPQHPDLWWKNYQNVMLHFADLAQQTHVDIFSVGSELLTTEHMTRRWHRLIAQIRRHFQGQLIYSTNWDHFHVPTFWDKLDLIGISGYWDMTTGANGNLSPSETQLQARWEQIQRQILAFATQIHRPVLITELGYPALPWSLKDPWNYIADADVHATPRPQAKGYRAFLNAWEKLLNPTAPNHSPQTETPRIAGVLFYEWDPYRQGGPDDTGYGIRGKPAFTIVQNWLQTHPRRPPGKNRLP